MSSAPRSLRAASHWALRPLRSLRLRWVGRRRAGWGGGGRGGSLEGTDKRRSSDPLPLHSVQVGAGVPRQPPHASYFLPVRWMCWNRVMEKAMPKICMMRMHIPTVPSTCLFSSNHIFTFS